MKCENCGEECWRDSADVGVGVIYGPWGCSCGWSESEEYNQLTGQKKTEAGGVADQYGIVTPVSGDQTFFEGFERVVIDSMTDASELISGLIASGKEFRVDGKNGQSFGRVHRHRFEEGAVPVIAYQALGPITNKEHDAKCKNQRWVDSYTYCATCGYTDRSRGGMEDEPTQTTPPPQAAPVGNQVNKDLKAAYEMGFCAAREIDPDDFGETQDYVDQRRSDLKELVSYNRSLD